MAQSAKLFVFEERADVTIEQTRSIPIELARTGRVGLTQTEISKLIGRLFIERTAVNLHSELLDAPEFLWEDDQWEPLYKLIYTYLDIPARVSLLNRRIDIMRELLDVLQTQMGNDHASKARARERTHAFTYPVSQPGATSCLSLRPPSPTARDSLEFIPSSSGSSFGSS